MSCFSRCREGYIGFRAYPYPAQNEYATEADARYPEAGHPGHEWFRLSMALLFGKRNFEMPDRRFLTWPGIRCGLEAPPWVMDKREALHEDAEHHQGHAPPWVAKR